MTNIIEQLNLLENDTIEEIAAKVKNKLGVGLEDMALALSEFVKNSATQIAEDFNSLTPYGDYDKYTDNKKEIAKFLAEEAYLPENWTILGLEQDPSTELLHFLFNNKIVDEGFTLSGHVYLTSSGKVKHIFTSLSN